MDHEQNALDMAKHGLGDTVHVLWGRKRPVGHDGTDVDNEVRPLKLSEVFGRGHAARASFVLRVGGTTGSSCFSAPCWLHFAATAMDYGAQRSACVTCR